MPWLAQAARLWRRLRSGSAAAVPSVPEDAATSHLSFTRTPAALARPKQRRGYADKMRRPGDYEDKAS